ncbi:hypothetical protein [Chryseobacterium gossypii]|uniref:hypothetical protein n=1 Tax=Chryseobacterium gossypii TaxID=3231602 RepID=UPI0035256F93
MKFSIDYNSKKENRLLTYNVNEYGFDMEPYNYSTNINLTLNYLDLMVFNKNVIAILGFCGFGTWIKSNYNVPQYKEGSLKIVDNLKEGVGAYRINKEDLPVYVNTQTGWICIGNPEKKGEAVEFINNCVAIIDDDQELVSLWLKPEKLPDI